MKITDMIAKWHITLAEKDGLKGIAIRRKATPKQIEMLKAAKPEIMAELERQEQERKERWAKIQEEHKEKEVEYLATADLHRCLVQYLEENYDVNWSTQTLVTSEDGERMFQPRHGGTGYVELPHVTETMEKIRATEGMPFGLGGVAYEITPEQEAQILAEMTPLVEQAEKEAQEKARKKEEEIAAKEARGITLVINTTKPHQGTKDECSYCGGKTSWSRHTAAGIKNACEPAPGGTFYAAAPGAKHTEGCLSRLMKEHEAWAKREGMVRCWECGLYRKPSELDESGYCGC